MILSRRTALAGGLSVAIAASIAACTGSSGSSGSSDSAASGGKLEGEITFQTWSLKNEKFTPYFEKLVADFQAANPGTTIKWIDQPGEGYEEKLLQQANTGELPDVVNLTDGLAFGLAKVGKLANLKEVAPELLETFIPGGIAAYTYDKIDGGTYGVPWYMGTDLCWWNKSMLEKASITEADLPKTQAEYIALAKAAAERTNGEVKLLAAMPIADNFEAEGVTWFDGEKFVFSNDKAVAVLQSYVDAYAAGAMPTEALNDDYQGNAGMFTQEKVGFTTATPGYVNQLKDEAPTLVDNVLVTKRFTTPPLFPQGLCLSSESKNQALALAFLEFASNNANQVEFIKLAQGFLPGTKEANENPDSFTSVIEDPLMVTAAGLAAEEMSEAQLQVGGAYSDDSKKYVGQQIALALKGEISAADALKAAEEYCNNNLSNDA